MRYRQQGSRTLSKGSYISYGPTGLQNGAGTWGGVKISQSNIKTMSDSPTANFSKLRAAGHVIMSPVNVLSEQYDYPIMEHIEVGPIPTWGRVVCDGSITAEYAQGATVPSWHAQRITDAKGWTLQEAYSKVADVDLQSYVTVAESGKTARMLASPFSRTEKLLKQVLSKKATLIRRGLDIGSAVSSAWLEYRLGWKPVLYDIQGIWDAWLKNTSSFDKPTRLVARRSTQINYDSGPESYTGTGPVFGTLPMLRRYTLSTKVSSGVLYEIHDEGLEAATKRNMGVRLSDVPSSLWELVPFSFVVDRFVSVGSWLDAIVPKPGVTIKGSWTTRTATSNLVQTRLPSPIVIAGTNVVIPGGAPCTEKYTQLERTANPSTSVFTVPQWNPNDLSLDQTRDHLALIFELLRDVGFTRK